VVAVEQTDGVLDLQVVDDGRGVPAGFDLEQANGLGLSIVRTLVTTELAGSIDLRPAAEGELAAVGLEPPGEGMGTGTVVDLRIPSTVEGR
jgi:two-component sensor histidine kinase